MLSLYRLQRRPWSCPVRRPLYRRLKAFSYSLPVRPKGLLLRGHIAARLLRSLPASRPYRLLSAFQAGVPGLRSCRSAVRWPICIFRSPLPPRRFPCLRLPADQHIALFLSLSWRSVPAGYTVPSGRDPPRRCSRPLPLWSFQVPVPAAQAVFSALPVSCPGWKVSPAGRPQTHPSRPFRQSRL